MCGFGASKCADVVRQNVVGMVRRNVRVQCVKVCGYNTKCRNGATECGNGTMEWQRNGDHERQQIDKIELCLRIVVICIKNCISIVRTYIMYVPTSVCMTALPSVRSNSDRTYVHPYSRPCIRSSVRIYVCTSVCSSVRNYSPDGALEWVFISSFRCGALSLTAYSSDGTRILLFARWHRASGIFSRWRSAVNLLIRWRSDVWCASYLVSWNIHLL